jgi:hypothetical protein
MNLKFAIKSVAGEAQKEGDEYVRFSGVSEPFREGCEREVRKTGEIGSGKDLQIFVKFTTGLEEDMVDFYDWYNESEKEEVKQFIKDNLDRIAKANGGLDVIKADNKYFWQRKDVNKLFVDNYTIDKLFDTKNPNHCLLYLSIISGAFMSLVAPTKEWAERNPGIPFYLALEKEASETDSELYVTKLDAQAALSKLSKDSGDGMFIVAWCTQYDSKSYGAYSRTATPPSELIKYHSMFIDGDIPEKKGRKRDCPKIFLDYANRWMGQQTKASVMVEAYVKAGEYYGFINSTKKKYVTDEGTVLGNTIEEAVRELMQNKNADDLDRLREKVEKKWNE